MMINDDLSIPCSLVEYLDQYRYKIENMFDSYIKQTVTANINPDDQMYPGVAESYPQTTTQDIPRAQHTNMYVLYKPGLKVNEQCIQWAMRYGEHSSNQWVSGHFLYPKTQGFMGWHTNSDQPGTIIYLTYTPCGGQSFFRYYDKYADQVVTSYDKGGWHGRLFTTSSDPKHLFWHCVYSETTRLSIGIEQQ